MASTVYKIRTHDFSGSRSGFSDYGSSSSSFRRPSYGRESSVGPSSSLRSSRFDSFTSTLRAGSPSTASSYRARREGSLSLLGAGSSPSVNRRSVAVSPAASGLGSETAKYNRELAIKEIHKNFEDDFCKTQKRYGLDTMESARANILGQSAKQNQWEESMERRYGMGDMYTDTAKFSTRTLAAVNTLQDNPAKKKSDYGWRKNMEQFEQSSEFKRDQTIRSIESRTRKRQENAEEREEKERKEKETRARILERPLIKAMTTEDGAKVAAKPPIAKAARVARPKTVEVKTQLTPPAAESEAGVAAEKPAAKKIVKKSTKSKKAEETTTTTTAKAVEETKADEAEKENMELDAFDTPDSYEKKKKEAAKDEEEGDDSFGTKKLKGDFDLKMSNLEQEMEAGRSKLAKLRERIRKAKGAIKAADDAMEKCA